MALTHEDLEQVKTFVQSHLIEWLPQPVLQLNERIVRVEEELRHQRELMKQGFADMGRRFEEAQANSDSRFADMDKRFEELREDMNKRFEQVDKRFEQIDKRFEQSDKRFDDMHRHSNRWMTVLTLILGLMTIAMTVTNVIG